MKLHNLISKLKKWIKILEAKTKQLPKFFLIEEKCRFLSNFSAQTAEVEIPGEFLMPKPTHYYIKIARYSTRETFTLLLLLSIILSSIFMMVFTCHN